MTGSLWINQIIWKNNFLPLAINTKRTTGTFLNAHIPIFLLYLIDSNSNYTIFIKSTWWICNGSNYCGRAYYWFISPGQWMIRYSCTHHLFRNFFLNRRILAGINFLMDVLQFLGHLKWQLTVREMPMVQYSMHKLFRLYGILSLRLGNCVITILMALFNRIKKSVCYNIKYKLSFFTACRLILCVSIMQHQLLWIKFYIGLIRWFVIGLLLPLLKLILISQLFKQELIFTCRTFYISWSENHLSFSCLSFSSHSPQKCESFGLCYVSP